MTVIKAIKVTELDADEYVRRERDGTLPSFVRVKNIPLPKLTSELKMLAKRTTEDAIKIGRYLFIAKNNMPHGGWMEWMKKNFPWSPSSVSNYINVFKIFGGSKVTPDATKHLNTAALIELARPTTPPEAREMVQKLAAQSGKSLSRREVQQVVSETRRGVPIKKGPQKPVKRGEFKPIPKPKPPSESEQWERHFGLAAGEIVALPAFWTKHFPGWQAFKMPSEMLALARDARATLDKLIADWEKKTPSNVVQLRRHK